MRTSLPFISVLAIANPTRDRRFATLLEHSAAKQTVPPFTRPTTRRLTKRRPA